jgi:hypothetical protein
MKYILCLVMVLTGGAALAESPVLVMAHLIKGNIGDYYGTLGTNIVVTSAAQKVFHFHSDFQGGGTWYDASILLEHGDVTIFERNSVSLPYKGGSKVDTTEHIYRLPVDKIANDEIKLSLGDVIVLSSSTPTANAPRTPDEAVAAFRVIWRESLAKSLETNSHIVQLKHQVFEAGRVGARIESSEASHKLVTITLSKQEKKQLILFGRLEDLRPDRKVWAITNPGDSGIGFEAYLDQNNGKLLFMWIIPEG